MNLKDGQKITIKEIGELLTNIDAPEASSNYPIELRGVRNAKDGMVCERDWGVKMRVPVPPIRPNARTFITGAVISGGKIRITNINHGYATNDVVYQDEVGGAIEANGIWTITKIDVNTYDLNGSAVALANAYTTGGIASKTPVTIVNGFTFIDSSTNIEYEVVAGIDTTARLRFYIRDMWWIELTRMVTCTIINNPASDDLQFRIDNVQENGISVDSSLEPLSPYMSKWLCYNATKGGTVYITVHHILAGEIWLTVDAVIGSATLGWSNGDVLNIFQHTRTLDGYQFAHGTMPHIRWNEIEAQKKLSIYHGQASAVTDIPIMQKPLSMKKVAQRNYFYDANDNPLISAYGAGYDLEHGGAGLSPSFSEVGSQLLPKMPTDGTQTVNIHDESGRTWLRIEALVANYGPVANLLRRYEYLTLIYDGYQESDPIFHIYAMPTSDAYSGYISYIFRINFALMPKRLTAIRSYFVDVYGTAYAKTPQDYIQAYDFSFQAADPWPPDPALGWALDSAHDNGLVYKLQPITVASPGTLQFVGNASLSENLGHAVQTVRSIYSPRYATKSARSQGALIAIDRDDLTSLLSIRNAANLHFDDQFVAVDTDNTDFRQMIFWNGSGEMLGQEILNEQIHAFRQTEYEWYDPQSGLQGIVKCDCTARRSILLTRHGLTWAGENGIYLKPIGGGPEFVLNPGWQNYYKGTLMTSDGVTPYVTSAYRKAIFAGWSQIFDSLWWLCQVNKDGGGTEYVCFVYSFDLKAISKKPVGWYFRRLNIGTAGQAAYFSQQRNDGTFTIGHATGILKYPNTAGPYSREDDVRIDGAGNEISQSKGIPLKILLNLGELHDIMNKFVLDDFHVEHSGSSVSGNGTFNIKFYANKETAAFETKTVPIDSLAVRRGLPKRGKLNGMKIEISLTSGSEQDIKGFDISTIDFQARKTPSVGNR